MNQIMLQKFRNDPVRILKYTDRTVGEIKKILKQPQFELGSDQNLIHKLSLTAWELKTVFGFLAPFAGADTLRKFTPDTNCFLIAVRDLSKLAEKLDKIEDSNFGSFENTYQTQKLLDITTRNICEVAGIMTRDGLSLSLDTLKNLKPEELVSKRERY